MALPFLAEIKMISWNFAPKGWAFCNGQLLPINQNQALFSILGTTYGGDGRVNFGLPNLQGRVPIHVGSGFVEGETGGQTAHTLIQSELPAHNHVPNGNSATATLGTQLDNLWAANNAQPFASNNPNAVMNPASILPVGGNQPHNNMPPYLVLNFIIALQGIFPSQN